MPRRKGDATRLFNRQPRARDRAWQSMRILRRFSLPDLNSTAEIGANNAKKYVTGLTRSGYLRCVREKQNGHKDGHAIWLLIRDTGPHAPRLRSNGNTYDPNLHQEFEGGIKQ